MSRAFKNIEDCLRPDPAGFRRLGPNDVKVDENDVRTPEANEKKMGLKRKNVYLRRRVVMKRRGSVHIMRRRRCLFPEHTRLSLIHCPNCGTHF